MSCIVVSCRVVSYRIISYRIISYNIYIYIYIVSYHISYHIIIYHIISYDIVSYRIISYHIPFTSYRIISHKAQIYKLHSEPEPERIVSHRFDFGVLNSYLTPVTQICIDILVTNWAMRERGWGRGWEGRVCIVPIMDGGKGGNCRWGGSLHTKATLNYQHAVTSPTGMSTGWTKACLGQNLLVNCDLVKQYLLWILCLLDRASSW